MKKCNFCGTENQNDAVFCEWCGNRFKTTILPSEMNLANVGVDGYRLSVAKVYNLTSDYVAASPEIFQNCEDAISALEQLSDIDKSAKTLNVAITVYEQGINAVGDILPFLETALGKNLTAVIVAPKCHDDTVKTTLLVNSLRGTLNSILIEVTDENELHNLVAHLASIKAQDSVADGIQRIDCIYTSKDVVVIQ